MSHEMQYERSLCRRLKNLLREGKTKAKHLFVDCQEHIICFCQNWAQVRAMTAFDSSVIAPEVGSHGDVS